MTIALPRGSVTVQTEAELLAILPHLQDQLAKLPAPARQLAPQFSYLLFPFSLRPPAVAERTARHG